MTDYRFYMCVSCSVMSSSFVTPWTVAHQAPLSTEFSRQECWSRLPFPPPRDLPDPGIEPSSLCLLHWQADSLSLCHLGMEDKKSRLKRTDAVFSIQSL